MSISETIQQHMATIEAEDRERERVRSDARTLAQTLMQNAGYPTLVYAWRDAPQQFRALSVAGGDEDFVIVHRGETTAWWAYKLGDEITYRLGGDLFVTITDHG